MMNAQQIVGIIAELAPAAKPDDYNMGAVFQDIYLAKSHVAEPCAVVFLRGDGDLPGPRDAKGLSLEFHAAFELGGHERRAALLRCRELSLNFLFAVMVEGLIELAEHDPVGFTHPERVLQYIEDWQDLLAKRRQLPHHEQIGLWGELQFILNAPNPTHAVAAWYGPLGKRFDFSAHGLDIDIKTGAGHAHHFLLEQLQPSPSSSERYICSYCVVDDPAGGSTLVEQVDKVRKAVRNVPAFQRKLCSGGYSDGDMYTERFTLREAKLLRVADVPRVHSVDPGVSRVQFVADVSSSPALTQEQSAALLERLTGDH